jgi:hypothetical protein
MMFRPRLPSGHDLEQRGQENEQESERLGISEQELSRLKNTTPLRVFYMVVGIVLLLLLIVNLLGANVFHFW